MVAVEFRADELKERLFVVLNLTVFPAGESARCSPMPVAVGLLLAPMDEVTHEQQLERRTPRACWETSLTSAFRSILSLQRSVALR